MRPQEAPPLLTTPTEKKEILAESGLDAAVFLRFTTLLASYPPERFVQEILVERLGVEELVIGYDHGFGRGRSGDAETLRRLGARSGFDVDVVPPVAAGVNPVSSSRIRRLVAAGETQAAAAVLGRPYSIRGLVVKGDGRGKDLGFPTANLAGIASEKLLPAAGVYAVWGVTRRGTYPGAMHLGPRPTFQGSPPSVELHLIDFEGDLYGEPLEIEVHSRLRDQSRFDSSEKLAAQIADDIDRIRTTVASNHSSH